MKNYPKLFTLLSIGLTLALSARAQEPIKIVQLPSLATLLAGEEFLSEKGGFKIALPSKPTETTAVNEKDNRGTLHTWELKEGMIAIKFVEYTGGVKFTSARDREGFLAGYISVFKKNDQVSSITETPFALGEFNGKKFSMLIFGQKTQVFILLGGSSLIEIMAMADGDVSNADTLLFKAANSFSFLPKSPIKKD